MNIKIDPEIAKLFEDRTDRTFENEDERDVEEQAIFAKYGSLDPQKLFEHAIYFLFVKPNCHDNSFAIEELTEKLDAGFTLPREEAVAIVSNFMNSVVNNSSLIPLFGADKVVTKLLGNDFDYSQWLESPEKKSDSVLRLIGEIYEQLFRSRQHLEDLDKYLEFVANTLKLERNPGYFAYNMRDSLYHAVMQSTNLPTETFHKIIDLALQKVGGIKDHQTLSAMMPQIQRISEQYIRKIVDACISSMQVSSIELDYDTNLEVFGSIGLVSLYFENGIAHHKSVMMEYIPKLTPILVNLMRHRKVDLMRMARDLELASRTAVKSKPKNPLTGIARTIVLGDREYELPIAQSESALSEDEQEDENEQFEFAMDSINCRTAAAQLLDSISALDTSTVGGIVVHSALETLKDPKSDARAKDAAIVSVEAIANHAISSIEPYINALVDVVYPFLDLQAEPTTLEGCATLALQCVACTLLGRLAKSIHKRNRQDEAILKLCKALREPCSHKLLCCALSPVRELIDAGDVHQATVSEAIQTMRVCASKYLIRRANFDSLTNTASSVIKKSPLISMNNQKVIQEIVDEIYKQIPPGAAGITFYYMIHDICNVASLITMFPYLLDTYLLPALEKVVETREVEDDNQVAFIIASIGDCFDLMDDDAIPYMKESLLNSFLSLFDMPFEDIIASSMSVLKPFSILLKSSKHAWFEAAAPKILKTMISAIMDPATSAPVLNNALFSFGGYAKVLPQYTVLNYADMIIDLIISKLSHQNDESKYLGDTGIVLLAQLAMAVPEHTASRVPEFFDIFHRYYLSEAINSDSDATDLVKGLVNMISFNLTMGYFYSDKTVFDSFEMDKWLNRNPQEQQVPLEPPSKKQKVEKTQWNYPLNVVKACELLLKDHKPSTIPSTSQYDIARLLTHFKARMPVSCWVLIMTKFPNVKQYMQLLPIFTIVPPALKDISIAYH